ncbi:uncharacterized protein PAPHI01_1788 [Pancytospora philotis]|nr:uncharacterized protein PAPHI01_1788 [Pancytospora philotis]
MINSKFLTLPEELIEDYHGAIQNDDNHRLMAFLRKYLKYIECDDGAYNRYFSLKDPLASLETTKSFMDDFNSTMKSSLNFMLKHSSQHGNKGIKEGDVTCYLGVGNEFGLFGMPLNNSNAFFYYTVSAQLGSALGTFRLAQCYEKGIGTSVNLAKAADFFRCSAKLGLCEGMHVYGTVLAYGLLGCNADMELGKHFLSAASINATKTYPYAMYDMGKWYENSRNIAEIAVDEGFAFDLYSKGAQLKEPNCMHRIAQAYEKGDLGRKPNANKALELYKLAAQHGQVDAQLALCELYFNGVGRKRKRSPEQSYYWALQAASKGSGRGGYILGEYAMRGFGVRCDMLLALWWFTIAVNLGYEEAVDKLIELKQEINKKDVGLYVQNGCCNFFC